MARTPLPLNLFVGLLVLSAIVVSVSGAPPRGGLPPPRGGPPPPGAADRNCPASCTTSLQCAQCTTRRVCNLNVHRCC
ncbi:hypothetical protein BV898_08440 [Hypsibius exemplaris]|uniref:Uncharacterized protein n=1 Tax=Hypsibius exemplaris TaxID=2072580 RepID=A0A1W0WQS7_HYPEX|nr:hypothetical protein BV898_08440 [Hypsibius exemplaris]